MTEKVLAAQFKALNDHHETDQAVSLSEAACEAAQQTRRLLQGRLRGRSAGQRRLHRCYGNLRHAAVIPFIAERIFIFPCEVDDMSYVEFRKVS